MMLIVVTFFTITKYETLATDTPILLITKKDSNVTNTNEGLLHLEGNHIMLIDIEQTIKEILKP